MEACKFVEISPYVLKCSVCGDVMNLPPNFPQHLIPTLNKNCKVQPAADGKGKGKPCGCGQKKIDRKELSERIKSRQSKL